MYQDQQSVIDGFKKLYHDAFQKILESRLASIRLLQESFIASNGKYIRQLQKDKNQASAQLHKLHRQYTQQILEFNKQAYNLPETVFLGKDLELFRHSCDRFFEQIPEFITEYETDKNRINQDGDKRRIRLLKKLKRIRYRIASFFRRKGQLPRFHRRVPLRNYHIHHLFIEISEPLWAIYERLVQFELSLLPELKTCSSKLEELFSVHTAPEASALLHQLEHFQTVIHASVQKREQLAHDLSEEVDALLQPVIESAQASYYKLGTFEGRCSLYRTKKLHKRRRKKERQTNEKLHSLEVRLYSLSEDWSFDADLYQIKNRCLASQLFLRKSPAIQRQTAIIDWLTRTRKLVQESYQSLLPSVSSDATYLDALEQQRTRITRLLREGESSLSRLPQQETIHHMISVIEDMVSREVNDIQVKRMIAKEKPEGEKMVLSDLSPVYLRELLQFEILPAFNSALDKIKKHSTESVIEYENAIHNLIHVSDYNLDTVKSILLADEEDKMDRSWQIIEDGAEQFEGKMDSLEAQVNSVFTAVTEKTDLALATFIEKLTALTENEQVGELRLRLLKAKAIKRTELIAQKVFQQLLAARDYVRPIWQKVWRRGSRLTGQLSKIYSEGEAQVQVSTEISNFLAETKQSLQKMPFLYQRLFRLEPIDEGYLFVERRNELKILHDAFEDWQKDRFAAAVLVAEKGSGITSLLHYFSHQHAIQPFEIHLSEREQTYRVSAFIAFLGHCLQAPHLNDTASVIHFLNERTERIVVVLEGLQHLYLRKVDGFDCLKVLFEIISQTNRKVFWVGTCTMHSWNYLNKVLLIGEYFAHVIHLEEFSNEEMVEIVLRRHNVSGYDLKFLPGSSDLHNRKLKRMPPEQQQNLLQQQYFSQLNQLAKGNLSVAFIFWMRSLDKIDNNVLYVNSMSDFKGNFIKNLAREKLFCLYALLIHDGLETNDFCKVMRYSPETGRMKLYQMKDDGLLLEIDKRYVINLLLYRPVINALKAHNLLH